MLKKTKKGYYILEKFASQRGLIHGFSTRKFGDMSAKKFLNENKNFDKFLRFFSKTQADLVLMEQIHGKRIKIVDEKDKGKVIPGIDGMVTKEKGLVLGVKTADCLPILFFDPKTKFIGIAHAGWKGVLKKISQAVVEKMAMLGSKAEDVLVGIGHHIGPCCYNISKERKEKFRKEFGNLKGMFSEGNRKIYLDLLAPMIVQLIKLGIRKENIDFGLNCTSCQINEFFSYRRDSKETFGETLGIISLIN